MLDKLPDDVFYIIASHLETAKDIRALLLTNKHLNKVLQSNNSQAWRTFVRSRFPGVAIPSLPPSSPYTWPDIADSLTWQSRAWSKRALNFSAMTPEAPAGRQRAPRSREAPFQPALAAHLDLTMRKDLVIWGAGQDLVARWREGEPGNAVPKSISWHRLDGKDLGYRSGVDDIKAVSLVEDVCGKAGKLGVLVGRDNGHLALLSADTSTFGERLGDLNPRHAIDEEPTWSQRTVNSLDLSPTRDVVAATTKAGVFLYSLPEETGCEIAPSTYYDLTSQGINLKQSVLGNAKWMGGHTLALGLSGGKDALRFTTVTSTGFQELQTIRSDSLEDRFGLNHEKGFLCPSSLTPINPWSVMGGTGSDLLLSAWRDGTIRLQDIRTPTPFDLVYMDNFDPWNDFETLLPYGTSHFVAGGASGAAINIFDFRWSQQYYHTTALPCGSSKPRPEPTQPFLRKPAHLSRDATRCDHVKGVNCRWHSLSQHIYYRPTAKMMFLQSIPDARNSHHRIGVSSLARASPLSPDFYIGISGGVIESNLSTTLAVEGDSPHEYDPHFGYVASDAASMKGSGYSIKSETASLMEIGDGLMSLQNDSMVRMPVMRGPFARWAGKEAGVPEAVLRRHRLDARYHIPKDFAELEGDQDLEEWLRRDGPRCFQEYWDRDRNGRLRGTGRGFGLRAH